MAPGLATRETATDVRVHVYRFASPSLHPPFLAAEAGAALPGKPKLLNLVRRSMRLRHYSRRTGKSYTAWIRRYILFHGKRHPATMGRDEIRKFLSNLAVRRWLSVSTQNQALQAIAFLYREVLSLKMGWIEGIKRAQKPRRRPTVLTRQEVRAVIGRLHGTPRLMASLHYGTALRVLECARLRVKDIDFATGHQLTVRDGKGGKDRVTLCQ